ncbi:Nad dependent epimerase [Lasiodiplodia theobromae]|uniref:Nad dependent epimerase n=1 Tax=Lasiodiplodia theobromae TaxID=45133 RepID=UPI0015C2D00C|nr:Nad dependent epimerase [Lasiodiplodia theobromae]KAF4537493.1 Nad dependent epimerase [Lasiodiplodia theobromae]
MTPPTHNVLILGAGGYLGHAIATAYIRTGRWRAYGQIRNPSHATRLSAAEITPILARDLADPNLPATLASHAPYYNAIVVAIDDAMLGDAYPAHLDTLIRLCRVVAALSRSATDGKVKPLVLLSSGLKDFGETGLDGEEGLKPITEESPLNPPNATRVRAVTCGQILEQGGGEDGFDAVLVRPSNLYGLSGSAYGYFCKMAERAAAADASGELVLGADPRTILHSTHVEDAAEAYVALSADGLREAVRGQSFNVAGSRYETLGEIGEALVREYGIKGGVRYDPGVKERAGPGLDFFIVGFSEWVSSEKIRRVTGWSDRRATFAEDVGVYRRAYEAALQQGHPDAVRWEGAMGSH